jgi:hypothetical protein
MKTLLRKVSYFGTSASINSKDVQDYANRTNKDFDDAFNDLEQELHLFDFVEEEKDGRLIFHKRVNDGNSFNELLRLAKEGFDIDTNDIEDQADETTRTIFGVREPVHKLDAYYIGDADEQVLNEIAKKHGLEDYDDLLARMDSCFKEELERISSKILEQIS